MFQTNEEHLILEDADAAKSIFAGMLGEQEKTKFNDHVFRDPKQAGSFKSLYPWSKTASGKKSLGLGVIDLDVIVDPEHGWPNGAMEISDLMAQIFETMGEVKLIDGRNALRLAHVTTAQLARTVKGTYASKWSAASEAAFSAGDQDQGDAWLSAKEALVGAEVKVTTKAANKGVIWVFRMKPTAGDLLDAAGVKRDRSR